jgi:hypothetical protein
LIILLGYAVLCYKYGDWKRWQQFYPTILYVIIGDLSYNALFPDKLLWRYELLFNHIFGNFLFTFFVFPSVIILFLTHYPSGLLKEILYIGFWTILNGTIEYISFLNGSITFHYGWNIFWSLGLYFIAFILIRLHTKYPLIVWPVSLTFALLTMLIFQQPILRE